MISPVRGISPERVFKACLTRVSGAPAVPSPHGSWVRARIRQPVVVRRTAAQVPALLAGLGGHRGPDPDLRPGDLPLGLKPQRQHRLLMILGAEVDPATHLRQPQLDAVMLA